MREVAERAGVSTKTVSRVINHDRYISAAVLERVLPRVYPEVLERAREHQRRGEPVYLVTASSQEFADLLAEVLELDGAVGTRSEIIDGRYTPLSRAGAELQLD